VSIQRHLLSRQVTLTAPSASSSAPLAAAGSSAREASTLLTPEAAGLHLGVSAKVLERWRSRGEGPAFARLSRKTIRYRAEDIDAFVAGSVVASTAA
jgi:hypothetical protein